MTDPDVELARKILESLLAFKKAVNGYHSGWKADKLGGETWDNRYETLAEIQGVL